MRAYASMYRPFRQTAISGHTRLISGHEKTVTYHAILGVVGGAVLGFEGNVLTQKANALSEKSRELAVWTARKELRDYCERAKVGATRVVRRLS